MPLNEMQLQAIEQRYQQAYRMNQRFIQVLIRATQLCAPLSDGLNVLYGFNDTGKNENRQIFNSTPKWCSNSRANKLHSLLLPINRRWGRVYASSPDGKTQYEESITDKIFNSIDGSNLHSIAKPFFTDLNIGCAAIWVDSPSAGKVSFRNIPGITLMPEYSEDPECVNVWFRRAISWYELSQLSPEIAKEKWSKSKEYYLTCGYLDTSTIEGYSGDKKYTFLQFVDDDFRNPVSEEEADFNRLILVNETLRPGEARGHGVILQILEDIELLNDLTESLRGYIRYSADPALTGPDQILTHLDELRGALLPTSLGEEGQPLIRPVEWNLNVQAVAAMIEELEGKIRKFFNVEPFGSIEQTPVRTATEVGYRQADAERQSVADLSRVANETLGGIMKSVYGALKYWGLVKGESEGLDFRFDSPAVDIQDQEDINSLLQLSELNTQINGQGANQIYMNPQQVYSLLAKYLKTSSLVNNSPQQVGKILKNMQEMNQAQPSNETLQPAQSINPSQLGQQSKVTGLGF